MSNKKTVLALVGSLRDASTNRLIAEAAHEVTPENVDVVVFDGLADVPFYNEDIDTAQAHAAVTRLREAVANADAVAFFTPEYNGTVPAVLSNAIDWTSRPYGAGALAGKPVAVVSSSPSPRGAQWANQDAVKSISVAGGNVVEKAVLQVSSSAQKLAEGPAHQHAELSAQLAEVFEHLVNA